MISKSKHQTQKFAEKLAKRLIHKTSKQALVVALQGDLGSGKTAFAQGFAKGLGIKARITSPTFLIIRRHPLLSGKWKSGKVFKNLFHLDLYHINNLKEILSLGFKRIINNPENIVLIEWPEKISLPPDRAGGQGKILPKNTIWIYLEHGGKENIRILKFPKI